jgi:phage/plasmid-like protein (TIGR03299 family)
MAHEVETMAWAHQVPWHGLGNRVEDSVTVDEMLLAAGLDWSVDQHDCWADINGSRISVGRKALVRSSDSKILTVTGPGWKPLQNAEALGFFREYAEAGGATLETAGSLRGGKIVWGLARVATGFTINSNDHVKGYILLVSPHEVGKSITVRTTSVRVVCANTLAMAGGVAGKNAEYRQSHIMDFDVEAAKATVELVKTQIAQMAINAETLSQMQMSDYDTVRFLAKFFQPMTKEEEAVASEEQRTASLLADPTLRNPALEGTLWAVKKAPGATPGNAWGVLNGVTYWTDHMAGRSSDARLFNSWLGDLSRKKSAVANGLLEMAA